MEYLAAYLPSEGVVSASPEVMVNLWAVLLALLSSLVVGALWYARFSFAPVWIKLAHIDMKKKRSMAYPMTVTIIVSTLTAFVLAHVAYLSHNFFGTSFLENSLTTGFWLWLGFVAARIATHDAFEGRPWRLTLLTVSHELVTIMLMALIIGLLPPDLPGASALLD